MPLPIKRTVSIEIELPFALRIADGIYRCRLNDSGFCVTVKCIEHTRELPIKLPPAKEKVASVIFSPFTGRVAFSPKVDAPEGASNRHSHIELTFCHGVETREVTDAQQAKYKEDTRRFLNAFLNSYRYIFSDSVVRPLPPAEFYGVRFGFGLRFRMASEEFGVSPKIQVGTSFGDYPIRVKWWKLVTDEELENFRKFLETNSAPPIPAILLLNAAAYIAQGEYRLAVVESGSALDVSVEDAGLRALIDEGRKPDEALKILEPMSSRKIVLEIITVPIS